MSRAATLMGAISDRANPVVVKELRQAVQSRLVIAVLLLSLLANVVIVCGYLMLSAADAATSERAGQDLFTGLYVVLVATCMIFVPLYAAVRLTTERNDSNIDLLFITTIAPGAIIRGKFWSALALTALIYSASMPFLALTYLLSGINLPSIFFALGIAFAANALAIMLAIFVGSVAGGLLLRILMFYGLLNVGAGMLMYTIAGGVAIAQMGLTSNFRGSEAWAAFGACILVGLGAWGFLYLLSVAAVSARSSNRMFPLRVFVTVCWVIFGVVCGISSLVYAAEEPVIVWVVVSVGLLSGILVFTLAERERWTPRVQRRIPRGAAWRFLSWLFFTGSAGGVIWCCALSAATLLVGYAVSLNSEFGGGMASGLRNKELESALRGMLGVLLFTWCYAMSGLLVRRIIAPKSEPLVGTIFGMALLGICGLAPLLLVSVIHGPYWQFNTLPIAFVIANPFVLARSGLDDRVIVFYFLAFWALLGLLCNISWFFQQWRAFRRYEPKPVAAPARVAEEPPVVHV